jgi:copper ion binding protein
MVEEDRYYIDVARQVLAAIALLRKAHLVILRQHMNTCVRDAIQSDRGAEKIDEITLILEKYLEEEVFAMTSKTLKVEGMSCQHCTGAVTRALGALAGVQHVEVSLEKKAAEIRYDESLLSEADLAAAIAGEGYTVVP